MSETRPPKQIAADKVDELIERLEKTEAGSRELDAHIRRALLVKDEAAYVKQSEHNGEWCIFSGEWQGKPRLYENRDHTISHGLWRGEYTASLDAAVALAERVLPGHTAGYRPGIGRKTWAYVYFVSDVEVQLVQEARGATAALAICIATLKAVRVHMHPRDREEQNDG